MAGISKRFLNAFRLSLEEEQKLLRIKRQHEENDQAIEQGYSVAGRVYEKLHPTFVERIRRALLDAFRFREESEQDED